MSSVRSILAQLNDEHAPLISKPELQQYSPYQTENLYCTDIFWDDNFDELGATPLLVQVYAIDLIQSNFQQIAINYP